MESVNYIDLGIAAFVLILGLKGFINGFFKELFGLLGIIGGVFVASRLNEDVAKVIQENLFAFDSVAAANFTGFLIALIAFWLLMTFVGAIFSKLSAQSGMGLVNMIFGFLMGAGKIFAIFSIIVYAISNVSFAQSFIEKYTHNSILVPVLKDVGGYIVNIDPNSVEKMVIYTETNETTVEQPVVETNASEPAS
jgi:membrane protein required for colicin V production